jgi:hypothetical protein
LKSYIFLKGFYYRAKYFGTVLVKGISKRRIYVKWWYIFEYINSFSIVSFHSTTANFVVEWRTVQLYSHLHLPISETNNINASVSSWKLLSTCRTLKDLRCLTGVLSHTTHSTLYLRRILTFPFSFISPLID